MYECFWHRLMVTLSVCTMTGWDPSNRREPLAPSGDTVCMCVDTISVYMKPLCVNWEGMCASRLTSCSGESCSMSARRHLRPGRKWLTITSSEMTAQHVKVGINSRRLLQPESTFTGRKGPVIAALQMNTAKTRKETIKQKNIMS